MALDTSRVRKRLPPPPADGSPALEEQPSAPKRAARPSTPTRARAATAVPASDGRSLRATGRTVQMNLKVTPEVRARMLALAETRGLLLAEVLEQAIAALERRSPRQPAPPRISPD